MSWRAKSGIDDAPGELEDAAGEMEWVRLVRKISVNSVPHPVSHGMPWDNGMGHPRPSS
jgi:hypothetical protein